MKLEYYQDKQNKWRWRLTAENGEIVGASSQGFASELIAQTNVDLLRSGLNKNIHNIGVNHPNV